jgi:MFS family permease
VALPRTLTPLRHRRYAALWTGAFCSNIGTWMEMVAVGILVQNITGQVAPVGIVIAAAFLPNGLIGPIGGALADRLPRRQLMLATTTVQTMLAGVLTALVALDIAEVWSIALIVFASGCAGAIGFPSYQSMMPDLVPREELASAAALGMMQYNLGRILGPALAGLLIDAGGFEWAFAVNTVSFIAVIVAIAPLELPGPQPVDNESISSAIRNGISYAAREPGIRAVMTYLSLNSLFAAPFIALVAPAAAEFTGNAKNASWLVTTQGVGAVIMALSLGNLAARFGNRRVLLATLFGLPPALALYGLAPSLVTAAIAIFGVGFFYLGSLTSFTTIAQLRASAEMRGRVMSALMVLLGTLYPLGTLAQGAIADEIGLRATTVGAAVLLIASLLIIRTVRPGFDRQLHDVGHADAPLLAQTE